MKRMLLAILTGAMFLLPATASAQGFKNKGLSISPVRQYMEVAAGQTGSGKFTVVNSTDQPMEVSFSVESFSVTDYTYDYRFEPMKNNWVNPTLQTVKLQPAKSHEVIYKVNVPEGSSPGGYYYTLFASTSQDNGGVKSQLRAALPLYLTVSGDLDRSSKVTSGSIKRLVFGDTITYSVGLQNTGNVHYFINPTARLTGPFADILENSSNFMLMPGTSRTGSGQLHSPKLPGIYKVSYGYTNDNGESSFQSTWILYLPPWSLIILVFVMWTVWLLVRKRIDNSRRKRAAELRKSDPER